MTWSRMIVYTRLGAIRCGGRHCLLFGKRDQPGCKNPSSCGGFPRIRATVSLLRKLIRTDISARNCFVTKDDICNTADGLDIQKRFPSWMWHAEVREFPWQPTLQPDVLQAVSSVLGNVIVRLFVIFGATFSGKKALTYRFRTLSLLFYFADRGEHWKGVQSRTYRCTNSEDIEACCRHHFSAMSKRLSRGAMTPHGPTSVGEPFPRVRFGKRARILQH